MSKKRAFKSCKEKLKKRTIPHLAPHREKERLSWRTRKEKELCAFLVHHQRQVVDQAVIMEALWPEVGHRARSYLYTCVSDLRKNLLVNGIEATVKKIGTGYELVLDGAVCDAVDLDRLLDMCVSGDGLSESIHERISFLYKGDYMGDMDHIWAHSKRNELLTKYVRSLRAFRGFYQRKGKDTASLNCLNQILSVMPYSEQDGRELIKMYMEAGNRSEAIRTFRQLEQAVRDPLNVPLEDETLSLYKKLVSSPTSCVQP